MELAGSLLAAMATYGPLVLGLALFLGPLGMPIPTALLVLGAGACARQGLISWSLALALSLTASVLGDLVSYGLGRLAGGWAKQPRDRESGWGRFEAVWHRFQRRGGPTIYLTRFLLPALSVPVNLLAGSHRFAFRRFLAWNMAGRATWLLFYGGIGYLLGSRWMMMGELIDSAGGWLGIAALVGLGIYVLLRRVGRGCVRSWQRHTPPSIAARAD